MPTRAQRMWWFALTVLGLLALYLLWAPSSNVALTFSGPKYVHTSYGILSWRQHDVDYHPDGVFGRSLTGDGPGGPPELKPGQIIWEQHGDPPNQWTLVTVENESDAMNYLALAATVILSAIVLWFAVLSPVRKLFRSPSGASEPTASAP